MKPRQQDVRMIFIDNPTNKPTSHRKEERAARVERRTQPEAFKTMAPIDQMRRTDSPPTLASSTLLLVLLWAQLILSSHCVNSDQSGQQASDSVRKWQSKLKTSDMNNFAPIDTREQRSSSENDAAIGSSSTQIPPDRKEKIPSVEIPRRARAALEIWRSSSGRETELEAEATTANELAANELSAPPAQSIAAQTPNPNSNANEPATSGRKLKILRLFAPESIQNGTQNVTLDCMFRFDPKLDQRLIVKWFFEDDLEPVYQWIPDLNKRVFSDKYEQFIDKQYDLSEDLDYLLDSHRRLMAKTTSNPNGNSIPGDSESASGAHLSEAALINEKTTTTSEDLAESNEEASDDDDLSRHRRIQLAGRLAKLAKMGGPKSRQLLELLRHSLHLEPLHLTRFRALRLRAPTSELSGRFSCSVSSLDGQDLKWRRLTIYEPARKFDFQVRKISEQQYNVSCSAQGVFPRPSLALYRQLAGPPLEPGGHATQHHQANQNQHQFQYQYRGARARLTNSNRSPISLQRPRLAATSLRRELLPAIQTQLHLSIGSSHRARVLVEPDEEQVARSQMQPLATNEPIGDKTPPPSPGKAHQVSYDISAWSLIDESSLSSNLLSQFECVLRLANTDYELKKTLSLHKGWHSSSAALINRSTLLTLLTILASVLALVLASASGLFFVRLMRGRASKRRQIHHEQVDSFSNPPRSGSGDSDKQGGGAAARNPSRQSSKSNEQVANSHRNRTSDSKSADDANNNKNNDNLEHRVVSSNSVLSGTLAGKLNQDPMEKERDGARATEASGSDAEGVYRVPVRARPPLANPGPESQVQARDSRSSHSEESSSPSSQLLLLSGHHKHQQVNALNLNFEPRWPLTTTSSSGNQRNNSYYAPDTLAVLPFDESHPTSSNVQIINNNEAALSLVFPNKRSPILLRDEMLTNKLPSYC